MNKFRYRIKGIIDCARPKFTLAKFSAPDMISGSRGTIAQMIVPVKIKAHNLQRMK